MFRIRIANGPYINTIFLNNITLQTFSPALLSYIVFIVSCNVAVSINHWSTNSKWWEGGIQKSVFNNCLSVPFLFLSWVYTVILLFNKHDFLIYKILISFDDNFRESLKYKKYHDISQGCVVLGSTPLGVILALALCCICQ